MAGDVCAETEIVVDVIVAIEVAKMRALALLHKDRIRIVGSIVAGDTERDALQIAFVRCRGFRCSSDSRPSVERR